MEEEICQRNFLETCQLPGHFLSLHTDWWRRHPMRQRHWSKHCLTRRLFRNQFLLSTLHAHPPLSLLTYQAVSVIIYKTLLVLPLLFLQFNFIFFFFNFENRDVEMLIGYHVSGWIIPSLMDNYRISVKYFFPSWKSREKGESERKKKKKKP